jgi:spermidine synthase
LLPGVLACFFLSGFAALLYQTAWLRQFSSVFGTSELAVATVLAAYMGGLAAGAAVAGRFVTRVKRPILVYGLLEAGIAISALAVPLLLTAARALYGWALGDQPTPPNAASIGQPVFYLLVAFIVLAVPTGFMGATLPLLTRHAVKKDRDVGPRVALLYATNTGGAVLGTIVAGFLLLPALGLNGTVWCGVTINALVFGLAAALARHAPELATDAPGTVTGRDGAPAVIGFFGACVAPLFKGSETPRDRLSTVFHSQPGWILPLMLLSGATAFLYEVLWTRMLAHVMGGSIYAFATMLAAFLTGIALGGGLAGKFAERRDRAAVAFGVTQLGVAVLSIAVYAWMGPLIPETQTTPQLALYAIAVMLPATVFIGATFPLAVRILTRHERGAAGGTARVYAWNTVGAIAGAILAGFFLIPALGFEGSIKLAVSVNLALALWTFAFVAQPRRIYTSTTAAALLVALLVYSPARPQAVISSTGFELSHVSSPRELFYSVGRSATVLLLEEGGYYYVRTNGLPEANIVAKGGPPAQDGEKWLTALPVVARPDTETMMVIGFGGGVALEGAPPSVREIDAIELEPEVMKANRALEGRRNQDPLTDPRVNVIINDARNALRLSSKRYDVIVSQPSHPWTAGASHLFTREFVAEAKTHLTEGGVFVQWMNSEFVTEPLLRTLAATLLTEFESVRLYHPEARVLVFLASEGTLDTEIQLAKSGRPLADNLMHYRRMGMNGVEDLLTAMAMDQAGLESFAADAPISTDDKNLMATESRPRADGLYLPDLLELFAFYDPLSIRGNWIYTRLAADLDFGYIARCLLRLGQPNRAARVALAVPEASDRSLVNGVIYQAGGPTELAPQAFMNALAADSGNMQARYSLIQGQLGAVGRGDISEDLKAIVAGLTPSATAVVEGWTHGAERNWAALAQLDPVLARSRVTDAWYPEAARLRAQWRVNAARDGERFALDAVRLMDPALLLAPDQNLHLLRASGAIILGDADIFLESSRYVAASMRGTLQAASDQGTLVPTRQLAQMRQNLSAIANQLRGDLVSSDPERTNVVLGDVDNLIRFIDEYPCRESAVERGRGRKR